MKTAQPAPEHKAFRDGLIALLREHEYLSAPEMLAIASHFVGQLIALQDQRKVTPDMAMKLVARNIEIGNASAIDGLMTPHGRS